MAVETLDTRVGTIFVIRPEDDAETVYLRAEVGTVAELRNPAHYLRAAMAGNRFGLGTNGAVLSLGEDEAGTVYLTQRRAAADVADDATREAALQPFAAALESWRNRLALEGRKPVEPTAEADDEEVR